MTTTRSAEPPKVAKTPEGSTVAAAGAGALGALFTIAAAALYGSRTALSVGVGAAIAVANLVAMSAIIRALLRSAEADADVAAESLSSDSPTSESPAANASAVAGEGEEAAAPEPDHAAEGKRAGGVWGAFAVVKMILLFGGIWILLTRGMVDPIPLVVGYGVLPLGIAVSGLFTSLSPRSRPSKRR